MFRHSKLRCINTRSRQRRTMPWLDTVHISSSGWSLAGDAPPARHGLRLGVPRLLIMLPAPATMTNSDGAIEAGMALQTLAKSHVEAMCSPGDIGKRASGRDDGQEVELDHGRTPPGHRTLRVRATHIGHMTPMLQISTVLKITELQHTRLLSGSSTQAERAHRPTRRSAAQQIALNP